MPQVYSSRLEVDLAAEESVAQEVLFRPLERLLCDGDPDTVLHELKQLDNPPHICGKVFKSGEPTYSCRHVLIVIVHCLYVFFVIHRQFCSTY